MACSKWVLWQLAGIISRKHITRRRCHSTKRLENCLKIQALFFKNIYYYYLAGRLQCKHIFDIKRFSIICNKWIISISETAPQTLYVMQHKIHQLNEWFRSNNWYIFHFTDRAPQTAQRLQHNWKFTRFMVLTCS